MNETPIPGVAQPKAPGIAVTSLVLGITGLLGLFCGGLVLAVPAIICGHIAYSRINRSQGALAGGGLALGGLITGYLSLALSVLVLPMYLAIAIPSFVRARDASERNACINNLRILDSAKDMWTIDTGAEEGVDVSAEQLDPYIKGGFAPLHCPAGGTYTLKPTGQDPTCSVDGHQMHGHE